MIGKTLDRFRITGQLGKGGRGDVYVADDLKLNRQVTLRILPREVAADPDRRMRFEREARALAALKHPSIVTIHSVNEAGGFCFLTMELVEGESLGQAIPPQGFELPRLLDISVQMTDAIAAVHEQGITHRDLRSDNVLITDRGRVKIMQFSLAKPAEGKMIDQHSDIFALGVLLYEMATGRKPFPGDSSMSTLSATLENPPAPIGTVKATLPRELGRIIERCLARDPEGRYPSASSLRDDLARLGAASESLRSSTGSKWWAGVAAVGLVAMAVVWMLRPAEMKRRSDPSRRAVGIMGFENLSEPDDPEGLGRILTGLITTDLAETGGMTVVSSSKIVSSLRQVGQMPDGAFDASLAPEAARLAGVEVMMVGRVGRQGERLRLTAELVDVAGGNTLGSLREDAASSEELFHLAGSLAQEVRDRLGVDASGPE